LKEKNKTNVGKVRFELETYSVEGVAHKHYTIRSTWFQRKVTLIRIATGQADK